MDFNIVRLSVPKSLLLLISLFMMAQVFAEGDAGCSTCEEPSLEDAVVKSSKKCVKGKSLAICNNGIFGGNLTVNGTETVIGAVSTGALTVNGDETVNGSLIVTGTIVAPGNVTFNPNGLTLNAIGSAETVGAREVWANSIGGGADDLHVNSGFNTAVTYLSTGTYVLTFNPAYTTEPVVIVTAVDPVNTDATAMVAVQNNTGCTVQTFVAGNPSDVPGFNIVAIGV